MDQQCVGILTSGLRCTKVALTIGGRCGTHANTVRNHGPHTTARKELGYVHKKEVNDARLAYAAQPALQGDDALLAQRNYLNNFALMQTRHRHEKAGLVHSQHEEIHRTGVNPDEVTIQRRNARRAELDERNRLAREQNARHQRERVEEAVRRANAVIAEQLDPLPERQLRHIAADPQNVHTTEAVRQTKDIVAKIRQLPVPEEYRWHPINASKTPFEIGLDCKLTQRAAWQMISQYAQATAIYDIEEGIYGKVLDCVWQFIKNSPDKDDLCKIIKREMEDNIGMCAQGNLSRICNVLAGYMDGVGSQESLSERLGRLLPPLMEIQDHEERVAAAIRILLENKVPDEERAAWLDPLMDD
jgi:hypothetical protein